MRRALFIATYSKSSPYKLGTHHICDELLRRGWQVTLITHPLGASTMLGNGREKRSRLLNVLRSSKDLEQPYKEYSRLQAFVPVNRSGFSSWGLGRRTSFGFPSVSSIMRRRLNGGEVDLMYMDNVYQPFWLEYVAPSKFVLRLPDDPFGYGRLELPLHRSLISLIRRADATICASDSTLSLARSLGARMAMRISNGVELAAFKGEKPRPAEYANLTGPIAIYLGACDRRVDKRLLEDVATQLPEVTFVVVGDVRGGGFSPKIPANLILLGARPYEQIGNYLANADVGLLPFDAGTDNPLVQGTDPLKLYQYLAAGLPVVSTEIPAVRPIADVVTLAPQEPEGFARAILSHLRSPGGFYRPEWLEDQDWRTKVDRLLEELNLQ